MENYRKVRKERNRDDSEPNVIRLGVRTFPSGVIRYAIRLLEGQSRSPVAEGDEQSKEDTTVEPQKKYDTVVLMGMGAAISNAVSVAEILKRRVKGLHQITKVEVSSVVDEFEPLEQGLDKVTIERRVPGIVITLSVNELDTKDPGYQAPIPEDQVMSQEEYEKQLSARMEQRRPRQRRSPQRKEQNDAEDGGAQQADEEEGAEKPRRRARGGRPRRRGRRAQQTANASAGDSSTDAAPAVTAAEEKPPVSSEQ